MTNEKAREYFSAYAEGTLDAGLAQSFEAKLNVDAHLRAEYDQFEATLKELESLRFEPIEVPFDLNEKISAAVDKSIYDRKRSAQPSWTIWLRNLSFGGVAAAAIFGAYLSINSMGGSQTVPMGNISSQGPVRTTIEQIEYQQIKNGVQMTYQPSAKHTVKISGGSEGEKTIEVDQKGWLNKLTNEQTGSAAFTVEVLGEVPATTVVIPGSERTAQVSGQGSMAELAKAIADKFNVVVILKASQPTSQLSWNLEGVDARKAAQDALTTSPYTVDVRGGVIYITDN